MPEVVFVEVDSELARTEPDPERTIATLASGGVWCPPNPIDKVVDRDGNEVAVTTEACDQVVPEGLANTLANALSKDSQAGGTASGSAGAAGWTFPAPHC